MHSVGENSQSALLFAVMILWTSNFKRKTNRRLGALIKSNSNYGPYKSWKRMAKVLEAMGRKRGPPETKKRQQFAWITSIGTLQYWI